MCCGIFKTAEGSFHPFVCLKRQTQSHPLGQIDYMFERVSGSFGFLLSVRGSFGTD